MLKRQTETILDVPIDIVSISDIIDDLPYYLEGNRQMTLTSINPQILLEAEKNQQVKDFLVNSTHRFPDGIGIVKVSTWLKGNIKERVAGIDLMDEVLQYAANHKEPVYFYGAKPEVVKQAISNLKEVYPALEIAGFTDGYTSKTEAELVEEINQAKASILFVALGSPRQEEWLVRNMPKLNCHVFQTIGGSLDVKSGYSKRAPEIWIKLNLEWVYRSFSNPKRLNRIFQVPYFIMKSLTWHLKHKES